MCFYTVIDYTCGDWRWGNMRLQCARQHRIGETCGHKLPHPETNVRLSQDCTMCQQVATKQRRLQKARADVERFRNRGGLPSSLAKATKEVADLEKKIEGLWAQRSVVKTWVRQTDGVYQLPPVSDATSWSGSSVDSSRSRAASQSNREQEHVLLPSVVPGRSPWPVSKQYSRELMSACRVN